MSRRSQAEMEAICSRFLTHHKENYQSARQHLQDLVDEITDDARPDFYMEGELIESFEAEIAELFGKEAAIFMPTGTMTQQILLRIIADRTGNFNVAFHPTCHLPVHENQAYQILHGIRGISIGNAQRLLTPEDIFNMNERISTLLLELPQRDLGGQLPPWEELVEISEWTKKQKIHLHMDGARVWQCTPFYNKSLVEIASLFDTVYVSFYKLLNGLSGAALCGPKDIIEEARLWRHRHGGKMFHVYPLILSAKLGMKKHLPMIETYVKRTQSVASVLCKIPGITVNPNPPHINMMHLYIEGEKDALDEAAQRIAEETQVMLFHAVRQTQLPMVQKLELTIGNAAFEIPDEEIGELFGKLLLYANG